MTDPTRVAERLRELADAVDADRGHDKSLLTRTMREAEQRLQELEEALERANAHISNLNTSLHADEQRIFQLRDLVIEAYEGEPPTNAWRVKAERLDAWPGALSTPEAEEPHKYECELRGDWPR